MMRRQPSKLLRSQMEQKLLRMQLQQLQLPSIRVSFSWVPFGYRNFLVELYEMGETWALRNPNCPLIKCEQKMNEFEGLV
jgi:hypothetical protein